MTRLDVIRGRKQARFLATSNEKALIDDIEWLLARFDVVEALCARWQRDAEMVNPTAGYTSDDVRNDCARAVRSAMGVGDG